MKNSLARSEGIKEFVWLSFWKDEETFRNKVTFRNIQDQLFYMIAFWYWSLQIIKIAKVLLWLTWNHLPETAWTFVPVTKPRKGDCLGSVATITLCLQVTQEPHTDFFQVSWLHCQDSCGSEFRGLRKTNKHFSWNFMGFQMLHY